MEFELLALECGAPPGGRSKAIDSVGRAAPDALRGRRPSKYKIKKQIKNKTYFLEKTMSF